MKTTFSDVRRVVFDAVSDRLHDDMAITIYYNGSNLRGIMSIDANNDIEMEKALKIFLEEFSK